VGILAFGVLLALILRLALPPSVLRFGFQLDPSHAALTVAGGGALAALGVGYLFRRHRERTERALAEQSTAFEEERRRFIRRLDHELKNPLTAIQVQLDNLQESEERGQAKIEEVRAQADRLVLLTRGLRRLADLETRPLSLERVEIEELLQEVLDFLQAPGRIRLDVQRVPWAIPAIQGDRELLLLAFRNLVDNALIYSENAVEVRARHTSGHLIVEVIDTGRGIPQGELPMVTEELYRGSNVQEIPGSGLGLAMAQRIVERHGGSLELRSRAQQGTIATAELPYEPA
jgi:two-component system OmpR family sensor kinase